MAATLEDKIAQAEKATAILDSMDQDGDLQKQPDGTIKIVMGEIVMPNTFIPSTQMNETMDKATQKGVEDAPKVEALSKGFMFQAGTTMAGDEPFYIEVHLIGEDQYAVSANKNGVLTRNDIKALRKNLKAVMNQEKDTYNIPTGKNADPAEIAQDYDDGMDDPYYEGPDY
jgi:hypothetical protein